MDYPRDKRKGKRKYLTSVVNKLSVIIPVFNAAAYLEKCVESVLGLPYEMELILIDDGSRDDSGRICDELEAKYVNVKVMHQENQGVSVARNRGLEIANGNYVWFVDADDSVAQTQQVQSSMFQATSSKLVHLPFIWEENGAVNEYGACPDEIPYNLWRCWFDREEIERQGLRFTVGRKYAEDQEFILNYLLNSKAVANKQVSAIDSPIYYYTMRPGSAMTKTGIKGKKVKDVSAVLLSFIWRSICKGAFSERWVWKEMKRLAKTLYVTIK